ncbi:hypothetical protein I79_005219 [Cricetulus griseus]|uniref:Uncharacterized protein n=1 Tax=Cricetulus griseus TaxID=10029 RepID=G3H4L5_CRIGR|nr:hypothetical protein I79_005219 [Cricetulus griseus]
MGTLEITTLLSEEEITKMEVTNDHKHHGNTPHHRLRESNRTPQIVPDGASYYFN